MRNNAASPLPRKPEPLLPMRTTAVLVTSLVTALAALPAQDPLYYTSAEIEAALDAAAAAHPTLAQKVNLSALPGGLLTHDGKSIFALKVSDNAALTEDEPAIVIVAQHHARELTTPVIVLQALQRVLAGYATDPTLQALVNSS